MINTFLPYKEIISNMSKDELRNNFIKALTDTKDINATFYLWDNIGVFDALGLSGYISKMKECQQNPKWHSEGSIVKNISTGKEEKFNPNNKEHFDDKLYVTIQNGNVWDHTMLVLNDIMKQEHDWIDLTIALFHDIGKPEAAEKNGYAHTGDTWKSLKMHELYSRDIAFNWMENMGFKKDKIDVVTWTVEHHMQAHQLNSMTSKYKVWKILRNQYFDRLFKLTKSDDAGSINKSPDEFVNITEFIERDSIKELINTPMPKEIVSFSAIKKDATYIDTKVLKDAEESAYMYQIDKSCTDYIKLKEVALNYIKNTILDKNTKL